ncbi:MAG: hypothetical protein WBQ25_14670 [Nitrososphaeraceae archaeon]|jgi:hypothetical protein
MDRFLKRDREEQRERLDLVIVAANSHYAGFLVLELLTLSEKCWTCQKWHGNDDVEVWQTEEDALSNKTKQTTLSDFLKLGI